jgi:hypothetical protein
MNGILSGIGLHKKLKPQLPYNSLKLLSYNQINW